VPLEWPALRPGFETLRGQEQDHRPAVGVVGQVLEIDVEIVGDGIIYQRGIVDLPEWRRDRVAGGVPPAAPGVRGFEIIDV
jgi:hypothetical protein